MVKCDKKVKAVLYEVSLYLSENTHDYEAMELLDKVVLLMDKEDFEEGKEASADEHTEVIIEKICNQAV